MGISNSSGNNKDIVEKLQQLLIAFSNLQFNQPPLRTTFPAPFTINFSPGEIKEIIPASTSPRRIVIKAINGECKLLLGTAENIELSAISVNSDRLVDERWQGNIFGYSANGAEILINIEVETADNNNNEEEEMPLPLVIETYMHSDLSYQIAGDISETIVDYDGLAGFKMFRALSFNPGEIYNFNVAIDANVASNISEVIFYGINYLDLAFAIYARILNQLGNGNNSFYEILKLTSKKDNITIPSGTFATTFYNTRAIGMFCINTYNYGWRIADIDYAPATQTFSILGV